MKYHNLFKAFYILLVLFILAGCGEAEGSYSQILVSNHTSDNVSSAPAVSSDNTSRDTSSTTQSITSSKSETTPDNDELVYISDYIENIDIDLKYASAYNFTKQKIYDFTKPSLRYGTVKKLAEVQKELELKGYKLLIFDAYRPTSAQEKLWQICPDPKYVSDPSKGFTNHCRGNTVDVSLLKGDGSKVTMPSDFDEFSSLADRDYSDVSKEAAENSQMLEDIMKKHGFKGYKGEWWHYTDTVSYDIVME